MDQDAVMPTAALSYLRKQDICTRQYLITRRSNEGNSAHDLVLLHHDEETRRRPNGGSARANLGRPACFRTCRGEKAAASIGPVERDARRPVKAARARNPAGVARRQQRRSHEFLEVIRRFSGMPSV